VSGTARRLEQKNRLVALTAEAAEADAHATAARDAHEVWVKRLADLNHADRQAREARRQAETNLAAASRAQTRPNPNAPRSIPVSIRSGRPPGAMPSRSRRPSPN
jgi:hypothetical protein